MREFSVGWQDRWGDIGDVYYYGVLGMMVFGLPFWWRRMRKQHLLLWGPFAVYVLLWAFVFVGNDRYHFPLLSVFALLGAIGLSAALQQLSEWRTSGSARSAVVEVAKAERAMAQQNALQDADRDEEGDQRAASLADERQRDAGHR